MTAGGTENGTLKKVSDTFFVRKKSCLSVPRQDVNVLEV